MARTLKAAICTDLPFRYASVYPAHIRQAVGELVELIPSVLTTEGIRSGAMNLEDVEVVFGTWGITAFTDEDLDRLPNLKAVFYAAGSVQGFAEKLFARGITVCSGWLINAQPVAEFTLAHILLACKGYFRNSAALRQPLASSWRGDSPVGPGIYEQRIGIVGKGAIGSRVIQLLKPFDLTPVVVESHPSLDPEELERLFKTCLVISNHLADKPHLRGIYTASLFRQMPKGATFINTGRGAQVIEHELVQAMAERPDLTAILDVTDPEPPALNSPLRTLPNIHLSSHISGSVNHETSRMAARMIEEYKRWRRGEPLQYEVKAEEFALMA